MAFLDHGAHLGYLYRADALEFIAWELGYGTNPLGRTATPVAVASATTGKASAVASTTTGTVAAVAATTTGTAAVVAVSPTGTVSTASSTMVEPPTPQPRKETVATVEMADEGITKTATVVRSTAVPATNAHSATIEHLGKMPGIATNPVRPDITIEFNED